MTTSAEIRATLVDALNIDLVGPAPNDTKHANEVLTQAPSKWYLTGFLAPYGAPPDIRSDDDADDNIPEEVTQSDSSEDSSNPEKPAARKALFPSSMGLSVLVSSKTETVEANVTWGDYLPMSTNLEEHFEEDPQERGKSKKKPDRWQRVPQKAVVPVRIEESSEPYAIDLPGGSGLNLVVICRPVLDDRFPYGTKAVSIFLVNYRQLTSGDRDSTFAFQTHLNIRCPEGFVPRPDPRSVSTDDWDEAVAALQYRDDYEFAVGHNVSALAIEPDGSHCTEVCTTWIPTAEVPRVAPTAPKGVQLGMESLALARDAATIRGMVGPLVTEYRAWIATQRAMAISPQEAADVARNLLDRANGVCDRIESGLNALADPQILEAFQVANRAIATARRHQLSQEEGKPPESFLEPTWRPFQVAFILLNLVGLANPEHDDRKTVDLLFFPTGGGKTEAYLGLAAFTLILRRLKYPGIQAAGMSVLMRYTLRLLTLDQLERASRLICALELERQKVPDKLGTWPFEIGLWVGQSSTPNRMGKRGDKDEHSARQRTLDFKHDSKSKPSPIPLERCPWCGEGFTTNSFQLLPTEDAPKNLKVVCVKRDCDFRSHNPLPILAVDEPIYRRLPRFIIATVDKFAGLPWVGQTGALFGRVTHYQENEGFYSPGDTTLAGHPLEGYLPPPDLIIQDELHLISGPLGTMVGLYKTAIDTLCCREENGQTIRPKVIASTATVRRASRQIQSLFGRNHVDIFPPPGPDRHDSFFAKTDFSSPGRLYVGVAAQGRSLKVILLRVYLALLAAAQKQWVEAGGKRKKDNPADPYMTLMGYFNSLRELGGSRRIVEDEVNSRLNKYGERLREGESVGPFYNRKIDEVPEELTSRVSTNKIANTKRRLSKSFHEDERVDIALATNMISVGLDIVRLGLMVVLGQPKTAAEYIQATSRVGRAQNKPGLVVTLMNIHRPRDRSHYERFQSWHNSFYRAVEATSVTPFSPRALDRGLAGVTVALARLGVPEMTSPLGASNLTDQRAAVAPMVEAIARRAEGHSSDLDGETANDLRIRVRAQVTDPLDTWERILTRDPRLQYQKEADLAPALLVDALDLSADQRPIDEQKFKAQRSLRDVEATVNLWIRDPYTMEGVKGDDE
ncbi:DISARM system helicase DrmA [Synechococcus sp. PCC 6312]|uniref:DISARM system helicase DrmA n=1 Tax=Synechococcus sp. (strain ATCC 27167 / PCC 6312) TaxID=195253 RepID=UPI00029EC959|nr:DISARM system helicase DrmA [Synechococcus sp. PCC 6312]AFY62377.1 helicase family protein with metal-binding cysteine cluster [Synechococcus sp. PCC 6312]